MLTMEIQKKKKKDENRERKKNISGIFTIK